MFVVAIMPIFNNFINDFSNIIIRVISILKQLICFITNFY